MNEAYEDEISLVRVKIDRDVQVDRDTSIRWELKYSYNILPRYINIVLRILTSVLTSNKVMLQLCFRLLTCDII